MPSSFSAPRAQVATLVTAPQRDQVLTQELVQRVASHLPNCEVRWLAKERAVDFLFTSAQPLADSDAMLRAMLAGLPIDLAVQNQENRRKKLLIADMDSTMIGQECIDELADEAGLKAHVSAITERAMRGEIEFEPALRERVALLKGLPVNIIDSILEKRITLTSGGKSLLATMRAFGAYTALVSGGFTVFTKVIAQKLGFDENRANTLLCGDGVLLGTVANPILGREAKREALLELCAKQGLNLSETLAVGDGANDLAMLQAAGLGVAFHAKPLVAAAAHARVEYGDLSALLYFQGYNETEIVND